MIGFKDSFTIVQGANFATAVRSGRDRVALLRLILLVFATTLRGSGFGGAGVCRPGVQHRIEQCLLFKGVSMF